MATTKTNITVQLTGTDGNIFCVIAKVREALRRNGRSDLIKEFTDYITSSSSYEEALCRVMEICHRRINGRNMKTILIEKTAKRLKFHELIITALLFITLLSGFGALYIAIPLAIAVWSLTVLCLMAFIGICIAIWWCHG